MVYFLLGFVIISAFFPEVTGIITIVPLSVIMSALLVAHAMMTYRDLFRVPGWFYYALVGGGITLSQVGNVTSFDRFSDALSTSLLYAAIPFAAVWLREARYREFSIKLIIVCALIYEFYVMAFVGEIEQGAIFFGPSDMTINSAGARMLFAAMVYLPIMTGQKPLWQRQVSILGLLLAVYLLFFKLASRTALIGVVFFSLLWFFNVTFLIPTSKRAAQVQGARRVAAIVLIALCGLLFLGYEALNSGALSEKATSRLNALSTAEDDSSVVVRRYTIQKAIGLFKEFPINGVGWGNFRFTPYSGTLTHTDRNGNTRVFRDLKANAHSTYFKFLSETGLIGALAFTANMGWLVFKMLTLIRKNPQFMYANAEIWFWLPGYLVWSLTHDIFSGWFTAMLLLLHGCFLAQEWQPQLSVRFFPYPSQENRPALVIKEVE